MSDENYNPDNDEFLNKLKKFEEKKQEIVKIDHILNTLRKDYPFEQMKQDAKVYKIVRALKFTTIIILLLGIASVVYLLLQSPGNSIKEKDISVSNSHDTTKLVVYIMNNIYGSDFTRLSTESIRSFDSIIEKSDVFECSFRSEVFTIDTTFYSKEDFFKYLQYMIKMGGNMTSDKFINMFGDIASFCRSEEEHVICIIGNSPIPESNNRTQSMFNLAQFKNCNNLNLLIFPDEKLGMSSSHSQLLNFMNDSLKLQLKVLK